MEFEAAVLYWIRDHLQFETLNTLIVFFNDKTIYLYPGLALITYIIATKKKKGIYYILSALIVILIGDFVIHNVVKASFARLRPCHTLDVFSSIVYCSGSYSFPSSQATNLFTFATLSTLFFRRWAPVVFTIAILGCFSKLYQGVHYPSDVLAGAIFGTVFGLVGFKLIPKGWEQRQDLLPMTGQTASIQRILLIRLSSLGDVIQTLPALRTLRQLFPNARITWIVEERFRDVLLNHPDLDEVMVVRTREWRRNWSLQTLKEIIHTVRELRSRKFDLAIDIQGLIKTGAVAVLSGAPLQVGFDRRDCREALNAWLTNIHVPFVGRQTHVVDKNLSMIRALGASTESKEFAITIPAEAEKHIQSYLDANPELQNTPFITMHLGVGYKTKQWDLGRFAKLGDQISEELGYRIVLTWGPGEEQQVQSLSSQMTQPHWVAPANTLHQSMALFRRSQLFIGGDTGTLHLCVALDIPTVSLYGPTDPVYNGPYGENHKVIFKELPCSFCYKRTCPTAHECMNEISVEDVFTVVRGVVNGITHPTLSQKS